MGHHFIWWEWQIVIAVIIIKYMLQSPFYVICSSYISFLLRNSPVVIITIVFSMMMIILTDSFLLLGPVHLSIFLTAQFLSCSRETFIFFHLLLFNQQESHHHSQNKTVFPSQKQTHENLIPAFHHPFVFSFQQWSGMDEMSQKI